MKYEVKEFTLKRMREILIANENLIPDTTTKIIFEGSDYTSVIKIKKEREGNFLKI